MKTKINYSLLFAAVIFLIITGPVKAQTDISRVSVDFGRIKNYQYDFGSYREYAFYPELKLGGRFFGNYLEWEVYSAYWDDGIDNVFNVRDAATYSYSSLTGGSRFYLFVARLFNEFPLPVYAVAGFSYHKVYEKYIGGSDFTGYHRNDNSFDFLTYDLGAGLCFDLSREIRLRIDTIVFTPIKQNNLLYDGGTNGTVKIGFDYVFNN